MAMSLWPHFFWSTLYEREYNAIANHTLQTQCLHLGHCVQDASHLSDVKMNSSIVPKGPQRLVLIASTIPAGNANHKPSRIAAFRNNFLAKMPEENLTL